MTLLNLALGQTAALKSTGEAWRNALTHSGEQFNHRSISHLKSTGVTNNVNDGSFQLSVPESHVSE